MDQYPQCLLKELTEDIALRGVVSDRPGPSPCQLPISLVAFTELKEVEMDLICAPAFKTVTVS